MAVRKWGRSAKAKPKTKTEDNFKEFQTQKYQNLEI
jgi:hypothetical protein